MPDSWEASAIGGRIVVRQVDLPAAIRMAQDFGMPAGLDPATASGAVALDATLDGTLGDLQSTGRIAGRSVTVNGLPPLDLDASFDVDMAKKQSAGTFRLLTSALDSSALVSQAGVALGGSLSATGTWSGLLNDPIVDVSVSGRDLTIVRGGSVAMTATDVTLDAALKGSIADLGGEGSVAIGSVDVAGRNLGNIAGDLTMTAGVVSVRARAPKVNAALEASIRLEGPLACDGQLTLADSRIQELGEVLGLAPADASGLSGTIAGSVAFKGDLRNAVVDDRHADRAANRRQRIRRADCDEPRIARRHDQWPHRDRRSHDDDRRRGRARPRPSLERRTGRDALARSGRGPRHAAAVAASRECDARACRGRSDHRSCRDAAIVRPASR